MPLAVDGYECAFCNALHREEGEAEECMRDCVRLATPDEVDAFACARCGELFRSQKKAEEHESKCTHRVQPEEPGKESCLTCRNTDLEGRRYHPCRDYNFAAVHAACEFYLYAPF